MSLGVGVFNSENSCEMFHAISVSNKLALNRFVLLLISNLLSHEILQHLKFVEVFMAYYFCNKKLFN